jgi:hypothetical protein
MRVAISIAHMPIAINISSAISAINKYFFQLIKKKNGWFHLDYTIEQYTWCILLCLVFLQDCLLRYKYLEMYRAMVDVELDLKD